MSGLATKSIRGLSQLVMLIGIALFVSAWTVHYWHAWVYLAVFAGASGLITAYLWKHDPQLLERRVKAGAAAEKEKSQKLIQMVASMGFFAEIIVPSLDHRHGWSHVPVALAITGDVLVSAGFFIVFLVFRANTFTSATIEVAAGQRVVSTGPYAIVRHPMYAGVLLLLLATPIALGSSWGVLIVVPMVVVLALRSVEEEKFLRIRLGGYGDYCERVRFRLVPFVW